MKSPTELAERLARQWQNADLREQRLLKHDSWPLSINIGKPSANMVRNQLNRVREHLHQWRHVKTGTVHWQSVRFQSTAEPINLPAYWELHSPSEWIEATGNPAIKHEYQTLGRLAKQLDDRFNTLIIRRRRLVLDKPEADVIRSGELAQKLTPGCAEGKPLRALSVAGIDSKFFERNRKLITLMLDVLHDDQVSQAGLEGFLDAKYESHHWLLIADLDGRLLPFSQLRVRATELQQTALPGKNILLVENERCLHQLPKTNNTLAILGSGLNLAWLQAGWLKDKHIAYWGDLDSWGLYMLGRARKKLPQLTPLLMDQATFDQYANDCAVNETKPAPQTPPNTLTQAETALYRHLLSREKGRLEQEFLPAEYVGQTIKTWINKLLNH